MKDRIGETLGTSRWFDVEQSLVSQFSASTLDDDPMHLDVEWAKANTPFGGTVAAGFWTTSMLITMSHDIGFIDAFGREAEPYYALNYGFNHMRLITPVPVGRRIRGHMRLRDFQERGEGKFLFVIDVEVEIEGETKPALVAEWLAMVVRHG
ncbi:MAG: MaoC family dehydratase N-terminal domain-containing protein [Sphingomonadaceae bacterium]|nr:MaoC family dehydratase N-terminal domain-containing protein [Sphingomonadaceae bacterium]